jgi:hypothetical protein
MASRRPLNVRKPLNCKPCRQRKIRCARDGLPCRTCVQRGCVENCVYEHPTSFKTSQTQSQISAATVEDLNARIKHLEGLVIDNISPRGDTSTSSFEGFDPPSHPASTNGTSLSTDSLPISTRGILRVSPDGYVRFQPKESHWNSILRTADQNQEDFTGGFPVGDAKKEELLAMLPPKSQCTQLKNMYMACFSPVSPGDPFGSSAYNLSYFTS